jgi:hypothetical protein
MDWSSNKADYANSVALFGGKIYVGGSVTPAAGQTALWRFNSNGSPDTTFSGDGLSMGGFGAIDSVAVQNTGKIVTLQDELTLKRYNPNGTVDNTFGQSSHGGTWAHSGGMALVGTDKVVAVGAFTPQPKQWDFAVMRVHAGSAPNIPGNVKATAISTTAISVSWADTSANESGFEIQRSTSSHFSQVWTKTTLSNLTHVTFDGLAPNSGHYFRVRAKGPHGNSAWSPVVYRQVQPTYFSTVRINSGGADYTTADNKTFAADKNFLAGTPGIDSVFVGNTTEDGLYSTYRADYNFGYSIPVVGGGQYVVKLHFVDPTSTAPGQRKFDVWAESYKMVNNLDLVAAAGQGNAFTQSFTVLVTDNALTLNFVAHAGKAIVSAIEVTPLYPNPPIPNQLIGVHLNGQGQRSGSAWSRIAS